MGFRIPQIDVGRYRAIGRRAQDDCALVAQSFEILGIVCARDTRLSEVLNARFQDLMVRYFRQPEHAKRSDERPNHQVGWTPAFTERPKLRAPLLERIHPAHQPHPILGADGRNRPDCKERFFIRVGHPPQETRYPTLNEPSVVPPAFSAEWKAITEEWGARMLATITTIAEMTAVGFGEDPDLFVSLLDGGPHLLAPTGCNLETYGAIGTVLTGFHDDLNCITGHARANVPGLYAWTRSLERFPVIVPDGYLLMQAGQQLEYLTGGRVLCGCHEVVVADAAANAARSIAANGMVPWRVTSTLFAHVASDRLLQPIASFASRGACEQYPPIDAGAQVQREIECIELTTPTITP